ncbi:hypothetical protein [Streptomyces odontomachi]|uniref:hypothetical protein n=1 Tax=Streptomyces odontomachi TaxID=2944940 RepID=UPI00210889FD|nr:hypothetical protein [Streptomyces sp. ODS25]
MGQFKAGDRVVVVDGGDFPGTEGRTGTVVDDGALSGGLMPVKGIFGRVKEIVLGYPGYYAEQLRKA